jgi:PilZ domain
MERRQHERYGLQAPVSFSWKDSRNTTQRCNGLLLNISGGGVFIATRDLPPKGTRIRLKMSLPTVVGGTQLNIRASAEVVRLELPKEIETAERIGLAAATKSFTLRSDEKKLSDRATADMVAKTQNT